MSCGICGTALPAGALFCGECGSSTTATARSRRRPTAGSAGSRDTTIVEPLPTGTGVVSVPLAVLPFAPVADAAPPAGEDPEVVTRFVLQFSTGESVTIFGSGLIGRRPAPQPGERFDHLVQLADRTLSVSKTHLEFGEHDGGLWIADRFSGNGTIVRRPREEPLRCEPGRRYLVPRGSRIDIAEQFLTVS